MAAMEARLLHVERGLAGIDGDLRALRRDLAAAGQGIRDSWPDARVAPPAAAAKFPAVCPDDIPDTLTLVDPNYGNVTLTWDGVSTWSGCQVVNYPGFGVCPAANGCPIFYTLFGSDATSSWVLRIAWVDHDVGGFGCPLAGQSCSTPPNISFDYTSSLNCHGTTTWGGASAGFIYAGNTTPVWSITLP